MLVREINPGAVAEGADAAARHILAGVPEAGGGQAGEAVGAAVARRAHQ